MLFPLFEFEMVILPSEPAAAPSRRESNWSVLLTLIAAPPVFVLVALGLDKVVEAIVVLLVPPAVDKVGDLTVVFVVPLVLDKVWEPTVVLVFVLVVLVVVESVTGGGGSSKAGALLSG